MSLSILLPIIGITFISLMTWASYNLGLRKTDDPKKAAMIGFFLSFIPPFAVIYVAVLLMKNDIDIV